MSGARSTQRATITAALLAIIVVIPAFAFVLEGADAQSGAGPYTLTQGANSWTIHPLSDGQTVEAFYGLDTTNPDSSATGHETSNTVSLLLWDGPDGLSLVFLIDAPTDGSGGNFGATIYGLDPSAGSWVVMDDPGEFGATSTSPSWAWASCCTDGGAWRGGLDGDIVLTVVPDVINGITALQVLSGPDPATTSEATVASTIGLDLEEAFSIHTPGTAPTPRTYLVEQGGTTYEVTALSDGRPAEGFYSYDAVDAVSSNTGLEVADTSLLFLWEGPGGTSLGVIHDVPNDGSGGAVTFSFSGLDPSSGSWVVMDDPAGSFFDFASATDVAPAWAWDACCTDGGMWRGSLDGDFVVTIDPTFTRGIDVWTFLSGSPVVVHGTESMHTDEIVLSLDQPVTITVEAERPIPELSTGLLGLVGMGLLGAIAVGWQRVLTRRA